MSTDIVERLRKHSAMGGCYEAEQAMEEAAAEITRLRLRVKELTGALIRAEARLKNSASSLQAEAEELFNASLEANKVSDPRPKND